MPFLILLLLSFFCLWRFTESIATSGLLRMGKVHHLAPDGDTAMLMANTEGEANNAFSNGVMPEEQDDEADELTAARREALADIQMQQ